MGENKTQHRMFQAYLRREAQQPNDEERQEELVAIAYANPDFQDFAAKLAADLSFSLTEVMHDQDQKQRNIYKQRGMPGLVMYTLMVSMDRVGMKPEDPLQMLYATQFVKEYVPNDVYKQVVNTVLLRLRK